MKHPAWIRRWPVLALAVSLLTQLAFADPLPNAWQITDDTNAAGSTLTYSTNLTAAQRIASTNSTGGFHFTVNARFVDNFSGARTMAMSYGLGDRRFLIWWELDGSDALTAELEGGGTYTLTANSAGTRLYHTHEIIYDPASGTASYVVDGQIKTNGWPASDVNSTAGRIAWGAGSSGGQGQMNFHSVSFAITGLGTVANYDAGTQGAPAIAPDPATLGWVLNQGTGTTVTNVSPDTTLLPVATTLVTDQFTTNSARLKGSVSSPGTGTAWFEWGTDTNYGNATPLQNFGAGGFNFNSVVSGLAGGPDYHYRAVGSNAFGVSAGADHTINVRFFRLTNSGLPNRSSGSPTDNGLSTALGDFDNDGRLDLLLTGFDDPHYVAELWRSLDGGGFTNVTGAVAPGLPGIRRGTAAWADYDNDGRLDFLIMGLTNAEPGTAISQLWRNTGGGFTNVPIPGLPGYDTYPSVAWSDYDNDGRLDFLVMGNASGSGFVSQLWRNTGSGFTNVPTPGLPGFTLEPSVAWGDYDSDGRVDILATGNPISMPGFSLYLWRNTGSGFTNIPIPDLPRFLYGSGDWGDYDSDGVLDFLITGWNGLFLTRAELWRNTSNSFTHVPIPGLPGIQVGRTAWGDFDNDGHLDFLMTGSTNVSSPLTGGGVSQLWRNTGSGFVENNLPNNANDLNSGRFTMGSAVLADLDYDGRLDVVLSGMSWRGGSSAALGPEFYLSNMPVTNSPPGAPLDLSAIVPGSRVTLRWNAPGDDHTPPAGLSYNVRIGTTPGGRDIVSPHALPDGRLLLPQMGSVRNGACAFYHLAPGRTYYWSAQAVDGAYAGSAFAAEQQFSTPPVLFQPVLPGNGHFQFSFSNESALTYEVLGTTNVSLPVTQWQVLGLPASLGGGLYQFTDTLTPNHAQRFYLLRAQ